MAELEEDDAAAAEAGGAPFKHSRPEASEVRSGGGMQLRSDSAAAGAGAAAEGAGATDAAAPESAEASSALGATSSTDGDAGVGLSATVARL